MTIGIALSLPGMGQVPVAWKEVGCAAGPALPARHPGPQPAAALRAGFQVMTRYLVLTIRFDHIILWSSVPASQTSV